MSDPTPRGRHKTHAPPLTAAHIRFCQMWVDSGHKKTLSEIYVAAGFPKKETDKATKQAAWRTVTKRYVREYIRHLQDVAAEAAKISVAEIAVGVASIAKADRRKMWAKGRLVPLDEWPDDLAHTLEGIETKDVYEVVSEPGQPKRKELVGHLRSVKTASRMAAWRMLGEWKRMFSENDLLMAMADEIKELREQVEKQDADKKEQP